MSARAGSFIRRCRPDTTRDNYDFHGLLQKVAGFPFAAEFDYVGFWDLRIAVAENYQVGRVFIAGDAAHSPSALWRLRPQQRPRRRRQSRLEARGKAQRLGQRRAAADLHRRAAPDLQGDRAKISSRPASKETGNFSAATAPSAIAPSSSAPGRNTPMLRRRGVLTYEPNYEGSPIVFGPPGGAAAPTARTPSRRAPATTCRRSFSASGRNVFEELGPRFHLARLRCRGPNSAGVHRRG